MFDRPSSWVGAAYNCQLAITGSIATRRCFTIELKTVHRGKQEFAPVPGNNEGRWRNHRPFFARGLEDWRTGGLEDWRTGSAIGWLVLSFPSLFSLGLKSRWLVQESSVSGYNNDTSQFRSLAQRSEEPNDPQGGYTELHLVSCTSPSPPFVRPSPREGCDYCLSPNRSFKHVLCNLLHAYIGPVRSTPMRPWKSVTRWRRKTLHPKNA